MRIASKSEKSTGTLANCEVPKNAGELAPSPAPGSHWDKVPAPAPHLFPCKSDGSV